MKTNDKKTSLDLFREFVGKTGIIANDINRYGATVITLNNFPDDAVSFMFNMDGEFEGVNCMITHYVPLFRKYETQE